MYKQTICSTTLNVTQSRIDSVRTKNITKSGCRVYKDGFIGIAGTFGEPLEDTWSEAEKNLEKQIPYPYEPAMDKERIRDLRTFQITQEEFMEKSEELLRRLREEFPDFIFSNKIKLTEMEIILTNDAGLNYKSLDRVIVITLIIKSVESANIMDTWIAYFRRDFDIDAILREAREQLSAFNIKVDIPNMDKMPVIITIDDVSRKFIEALNGEMIGRKSSLFNDKIGTKTFNENFSMYVDVTDENYLSSFFDNEGSVLPDDKYYLIENGTIITGYTDKKNSERYSVPITACGGGEYNDVPSLKPPSISVKPSDKTLAQLLDGKEAILVVMMSGGDWTNEGNFASPVQTAYLMKDGKMAGKLPDFSISGNIYEMFGDDYIGLSKDEPYFSNKSLVLNMKITSE